MIAALVLALAPFLAGEDALARNPAELARAEPGRWDGLFEGRDVVAEKLPQGLAGLLLEARNAYEQGDYPRAIGLHYDVLEREPDFPPTLLELGTTYFRLRRYGDAIVCLERFLEEAPGQAWRTQALAHSYYTLGDYAKAKAHYEVVLEGASDSVEAARGLALSNYRLGDLARALDLLDRALELEPDHGEALLWKAQILYESDRPEAALGAVERAREVDRYSPRVWYLLSQVLYDLGRDEDAREARSEWEELDRLVQEARSVEAQLLYRPRDFDLAMRLATIQREIGDARAVREALVRALHNRPDDVRELDLRIGVLDFLFDMGDLDGAALAAEDLARSCAHEPEAWKRLETYFARIKDTARQVRAGEMYLRLSSGE